MEQQRDIVIRVLSIAICVLAAAVLIEQIVYFRAQAQLSSLENQVSTLQEQNEDAQINNETLQKKYNKRLITWRNAQGRLSQLGDGTGKVCYLTFDDGPYPKLTKKNLKTLKKYDASATWFCLANEADYEYLDLNLCQTIEEAGCALGIHDWDQNESYDYYRGSVDDYFEDDFNKAKTALEAAVGHEINIMRFAGGSTTIGYYNSKLKTKLPRAMIEAGYQYFDWNVSAGDSEPDQMVGGSVPKAKIISNVLSQARYYAKSDSPICVLMHDNPGKDTTAAALPQIIKGLKKLGYSFATLDWNSPGFYQMIIE